MNSSDPRVAPRRVAARHARVRAPRVIGIAFKDSGLSLAIVERDVPRLPAAVRELCEAEGQ